MNTKLTLQLDGALIRRAKEEALRRGKSVSQMVADYFNSFNDSAASKTPSLPPVTASLVGILKGSKTSEDDYINRLRKKLQ